MSENLLDAAIAGKEVQAIYAAAKAEGRQPSNLITQIASVRVVIMQRGGKQSIGIGEGLRTKINANTEALLKFFISMRKKSHNSGKIRSRHHY
ncbi:MAG: phosphomethylpyrimidine synthase ThiC [Methanothrix sp.]|nr:phosphomethylpyrimidine synthase ThiC [Methanothrix sp.]